MTKNKMTPEDIAAFKPAEKIGLVASLSPQGLPHMTLITSIQARNTRQLTLGQFCKGLSKAYIQENPDIAFLVMTLDRKLWRGRAQWTHRRVEGPEYEKYNDIPMFRYNTYFGINTVHYLDLMEIQGPEELPMGKIVRAALRTRWAKGGARTKDQEAALKPFAQKLYNKLDVLKFISYVAEDGIPVIVPAIQCQAADSRRLAFSTCAYTDELSAIPKGKKVAVYALSMKMENVLIRGTFEGVKKYRFMELGTIGIEWVYNSMPPCHGQIYPEIKNQAVFDF
jgi:hypothetical protein